MEDQHIRVIEDVDTLKALADPTRLAILSALSKSLAATAPAELPVMSVKELAAELGEPQTKLYRHVKQLEAAGLIRVAATRLVSGILEQRYQAAQVTVQLGMNLARHHPAETELALRVAADMFLNGIIEANKRDLDPSDPLRLALQTGTFSLSSETAKELRRRIVELWEWLDRQPEGPDTVSARLLTGFYLDRRDT